MSAVEQREILGSPGSYNTFVEINGLKAGDTETLSLYTRALAAFRFARDSVNEHQPTSDLFRFSGRDLIHQTKK